MKRLLGIAARTLFVLAFFIPVAVSFYGYGMDMRRMLRDAGHFILGRA